MKLFLGWLLGVPAAILFLFNFWSLDAAEVFAPPKASVQAQSKAPATPASALLAAGSTVPTN